MMNIPDRFYPTTDHEVAWNFLNKKVSKASRRKAGQTVMVQAMLRRLEAAKILTREEKK